jgi:hypothetical protein
MTLPLMFLKFYNLLPIALAITEGAAIVSFTTIEEAVIKNSCELPTLFYLSSFYHLALCS